MPSWTDLVNTFESQPNNGAKTDWLLNAFNDSLIDISKLRQERNVLFYGSAFLQKPHVSGNLLSITSEDINGFMTMIHGLDCTKGLTLLLHTPGGVTNATETIVSYLRSKFDSIEVIIPTFAMSAGTMISLSADNIIMGRQSQLGPIDPQMPVNGNFVSAISILDQFERAKKEIAADLGQAHLWAPILPSLGPALIQDAQNAIDYSELIVTDWLEKYMFKLEANAKAKASAVAKHFSRGSKKKSHGRRIDREEAGKIGVIIEDLELDQALQESVLTAYHLMTIIFEKSPTVKILANSAKKMWAKAG